MSNQSDPFNQFFALSKKEKEEQDDADKAAFDQKDSYAGKSTDRRGGPSHSMPTTIDMSSEPVEKTTSVTLDDGSKIVKYEQPQEMPKLVKDAKKELGGDKARFFSNGWVIGKGLAKISPDGSSIIYYPEDVAHLVKELLEH